MPADDLAALLRPRSIAVVGASADPSKLNGRIVRFLQDKGYPGAIYPINPNAREILGLRAYPALSEVPATVDLAIIGLPAGQAAQAVLDAGRHGVRAAIVFASGFSEMGAEGRALQEELADAARRAGVRLCGPNSVGVVNAFDRVVATFSQVGNNEVRPGPLAFVTQSGAIGTVVNTLATRRGLGLGYLVHTGNEADLSATEVLSALSRDERVRVVGGYLEGVRDGAALCSLAESMRLAGKPLVLVKVGRSAAGMRAAASHTGALAAQDRVFEAVVRQYGITRARNESHLLDLAEAFACCPPAPAGGLAVITQSGGTAVLMADRAEELGLDLPTLAPGTVRALEQVLPPFASFVNPVDASMQAVADPSLLTRGLQCLLDDPGVACAIAWLQHMDAKADQLVAEFIRLKGAATKPWIVAWAAAPAAAVQALQRHVVCVAPSADTAVDMAHALIAHGQARRLEREAPAVVPIARPAGLSGAVPTLQAAQLLSSQGVRLLQPRLARSADEARQMAAGCGGPLALKVESPQILHKTEVGGVRLGVLPDRAGEVYQDLVAGVAAAAPQARIDGVVVQPMAAPGLELVVGLRRDPVFGMLVMVGIGGVMVEAYADVVFRRAPIGPGEAGDMLQELRGRRLLEAFRGRPAVSRQAVAELVSRVSVFGAAAAAWLLELDLNPVIAGPDSAVVVDWLLIATEEGN
jgi:acetate---CoA ligase (ADP-forming)